MGLSASTAWSKPPVTLNTLNAVVVVVCVRVLVAMVAPLPTTT